MAKTQKSTLSRAARRLRLASRVLRGQPVVYDAHPKQANRVAAPAPRETHADAVIAVPGVLETGRSTIVDVGMHKGQDALHYRRRGFRVVCFEANRTLCDHVAKVLKDQKAGDVDIRNLAICDSDATEIELYINNRFDEWSSLDRELGGRQFGSEVSIVTVGNLTQELNSVADDILFAKIDIEGLDDVALGQILKLPVMPSYISVENGSLPMFDMLRDAGYDGFKFSNQKHVVGQQIPPAPAHGVYSEHTFEFGASGLFGEDLPGPWLSFDEARKLHQALQTAAAQQTSPNLFAEVIGWFDLHARHASAAS